MRRIAAELTALLIILTTAFLGLGLVYSGPRTAAFDVTALPAMLPASGLHAVETLADRPGSFRWTKGEGVLQPPNPGGRLVLRMRLSSGIDGPTRLELAANRLSQHFMVQPGLRTYYLLLPPHPGERLTLVLRSPPFEIRGRQLGIVVQSLLIGGQDRPPALLLAMLLFATVSWYALLRRAGLSAVRAAAGVLGLQIAACALQTIGAWRYAFLGNLLFLGGIGAVGALLIERLWPPLPPPIWPPLAGSRRDALALGGLLALALACCLPWLTAPDPVGDLELSARWMGFMMEGRFADLSYYGCDYLPLNLATLWLLGPLVSLLGGTYYDPLPAVTRVIVKLPSLAALLFSVALIYRWARRHGGVARSALLGALYAAAPPVWINVAWWGQVDVLLTLPMAAAVIWLDRWRGRGSWLAWATGLLIKAQAIVLAPLIYAATLRRYGPRGFVEGALIALSLIVALSTPLVLLGEGPGLYQTVVGSVGRFPQVTNRAYNLWWLVVGDQRVSDLTEWAGISYRTLGFLLVGAAALLVMPAVLRQPHPHTYLVGAATLGLAFFTLPTQIHERYAFFALPFLLLASAADPRLLLPYTVLAVNATINIFGAIGSFTPELMPLIRDSALPEAVAWVNLAILMGLLVYLYVVPQSRNVSATFQVATTH
ncbi:MAG: hypothetical protein RMK84_17465 [Oscillochloridaceae bacterium]|nr:hypothetical protein [Chloroflexaceae bacterium]MDW8391912.1 hypothetical protein [Oscillochloridaceae bacterium]